MLHTTIDLAGLVVVRMDGKGAPEPGSAQLGRREDETGQGKTDTWRPIGALAAQIVRGLDRAAHMPRCAGPEAPEVPLSRGLRGRQDE
jgi:hypothetical protein